MKEAGLCALVLSSMALVGCDGGEPEAPSQDMYVTWQVDGETFTTPDDPLYHNYLYTDMVGGIAQFGGRLDDGQRIGISIAGLAEGVTASLTADGEESNVTVVWTEPETITDFTSSQDVWGGTTGNWAIAEITFWDDYIEGTFEGSLASTGEEGVLQEVTNGLFRVPVE